MPFELCLLDVESPDDILGPLKRGLEVEASGEGAPESGYPASFCGRLARDSGRGLVG